MIHPHLGPFNLEYWLKHGPIRFFNNYYCLQKYRDLAQSVIDLPNFGVWTGSAERGKHHYGKHGLMRHTFEVLDYCDKVASEQNNIDFEVLMLAALFHDVGKMWDYAPVDGSDFEEWVKTNHCREIHHISRSGLFWMEKSAEFKIPIDIREKVLHCILSHHGCREWGSPVSPKSREAWTLHLCDCLSARLTDCETSDIIYERNKL